MTVKDIVKRILEGRVDYIAAVLGVFFACFLIYSTAQEVSDHNDWVEYHNNAIDYCKMKNQEYESNNKDKYIICKDKSGNMITYGATNQKD